MMVGYLGYPGADAMTWAAKWTVLFVQMQVHEFNRVQRLKSLAATRNDLSVRVPDFRLHISGERYVL